MFLILLMHGANIKTNYLSSNLTCTAATIKYIKIATEHLHFCFIGTFLRLMAKLPPPTKLF